ncbi:aspartate ammonia-lyase [Candidatus Woesearchaeota archaeon]|nr:aspartate ammonia-lyase [Candidatus Woesearchaeota archaeon]
MPGMRKERDSLGQMEVEDSAYYGIFTKRALQNFRISGARPSHALLLGIAQIKKAAAAANSKTGMLDRKIALAIQQGAEEILKGTHMEQFPLEKFTAGAGTAFNMNMNEVIANLAIEKLGSRKGQYGIVHPNNHVNMSQSSNDVIPTAIRLAALQTQPQMLNELAKLETEFLRKAGSHRSTIKPGRTHLQDAVPATYSQVLTGYATATRKCRIRIQKAASELLELGIGGTAIGTGITTHPKFQKEVVSELCKITGLQLKLAEDTMETTWSMACFLQYSSALRTAAAEFTKICNDLMLLSSGPKTGIAEITLPEVEPGSSIMPGKVNPSIPECMTMICSQIIGNDLAVMEAAKAGQLELNVNTPLIADRLLESISILASGTRMLREKCVSGMTIDTNRAAELAENSLIMATALSPYLGYEIVAELVKQGLKEKKTIRQMTLEHNLIPEKDLNIILDPLHMTRPAETDQKLLREIRAGAAYRQFRRSNG